MKEFFKRNHRKIDVVCSFGCLFSILVLISLKILVLIQDIIGISFSPWLIAAASFIFAVKITTRQRVLLVNFFIHRFFNLRI